MNQCKKIVIFIIIIIAFIISINGINMPYYEEMYSSKLINQTIAGEITQEMNINQTLIFPEKGKSYRIGFHFLYIWKTKSW